MSRKPAGNLRYLWEALVRIAVSVLFAGVLYFVWMTTFLFTTKLDNSAVELVLWVLAPVVTAVGFAAGIAVFERLSKRSRTRFLHIYRWPLIGCVIGAGAVYWFGPMLIVFGMFAAGTASIVLREVILGIRKRGV